MGYCNNGPCMTNAKTSVYCNARLKNKSKNKTQQCCNWKPDTKPKNVMHFLTDITC